VNGSARNDGKSFPRALFFPLPSFRALFLERVVKASAEEKGLCDGILTLRFRKKLFHAISRYLTVIDVKGDKAY